MSNYHQVFFYFLCVFILIIIDGVKFRRDLKIFMRYNVKVNMFPPDTIFAYADGFRLNWDIVGPKKQGRSLTSPGNTAFKEHGTSLPSPHYTEYYMNSSEDRVSSLDRSNELSLDSSAKRIISSVFNKDNLMSSLESLLFTYNHNGTACLQRAKCEAHFMRQPHDILTHLYLELFGPDPNEPEVDTCEIISTTHECSISLLHWITSLETAAEFL
uniref:Uncharacterized protein n=1 Tax=Cacopsylla melanoneura TaxID=428564 RepID=A0A8D9A9X7_9HEMI